VAVEVRTINSRYFKLAVRINEGYGALEPAIEEIVRKTVRRGTIQVNVRIDRAFSPTDFKINTDVLERYRSQLEPLKQQWNRSEPVALESLLMLPGVVDESALGRIDAAADWPLIGPAVEAALENLAHMRIEEGRAMAVDLQANCQMATSVLGAIQCRAPLVVEAGRTRIEERLKRILAEFEVTLNPSDVIKEVSLMADRGDISEEIVRLRSHLDQFATIMELPDSSGRKLEFLIQEMFREANTIGSKASDVEIARHVIEIKAAIERMREMIQNIE
jgi:uncharacterized protein (TIGR00255 family)